MNSSGAINYILRIARKARLNMWRLEGEERISKKPMSIHFFGSGVEKTYLAELAFGDSYRETMTGKEWLWNIRRVKKQRLADIVVVTNIGAWLYRYLSDGKDFYIPNWVRGEIIFNEALARMKKSSHLKSDLRRIRKNNLEYKVTRSASLFEEFYHTMYVPYISKAFGRTALMMSHERMKELEGNSELMLVMQNEVPLAGQILVYEHDRVRCWCIGVKDGNYDYVKMGAQAALYLYEIQYLSERGYKAMHVGASRSFLKDGVLRFKNKWGMSMLGPTSKGFMLKLLRKSEGALSFLINNPFIHIESDRYAGAVFANDTLTTSDCRDIYAQYRSSGLYELQVYSDTRHDKNSILKYGNEESISIASTDTLV